MTTYMSRGGACRGWTVDGRHSTICYWARRFADEAANYNDFGRARHELDPDWLECARTVEELAQRLGIAGRVLRETVERYNSFSALGVDEDFGRGSYARDTYLFVGHAVAFGNALGEVLHHDVSLIEEPFEDPQATGRVQVQEK